MIKNKILSVKGTILAGFETDDARNPFGGRSWGCDHNANSIAYICCDLHDICNLDEDDNPIWDDRFFRFISKIGGGALPSDMILQKENSIKRKEKDIIKERMKQPQKRENQRKQRNTCG